MTIMTNTNHVIVVGNLTGDVELKQNDAGISYFQFSIAVNSAQYNAETKAYDKKTDFINNLAIFGKRAEAIAPLMKKGTKLLIEGHLQTNSYEKNGTAISTLGIKIEKIEFMRFVTPATASAADMTEPDIKVDPNEPIYEESENDFGIY